MTRYELLDLLERLKKDGGFNPFVEILRCRNELPVDMWKTLSAFVNSGGGSIILGAEWKDNYVEITGVDKVADITESVRSLCSQMSPKLDLLISHFSVEGKDLLVLETGELPPGDKPCYYRGQGLYGGSCI